MTPATALERFGPPRELAPPSREDLPLQLPHELMIAAVERVQRKRGITKAMYRNRRNSLQTVWEALWRRARADGSAAYATSGGQLSIACGAARHVSGSGLNSTVADQLELLEAAGLCVVGGEKDASGRWRRMRVRLLALDPAFVEELKKDAGWTGDLSRSSHER